MSKLSFRARALDAFKAMSIYRDTEIPDNADCSNINRTVPQMPTGMEKEEESEHHLQQAICTGTTIPTPEVYSISDLSIFDCAYPPDYKIPRQLIYMQPFSMEADIPDYDMDSDDEAWISGQSIKLELTPDKFEEMMDRLEKGSGQTVVTLQEAKALIKEDDDLIMAVYDYWLTKRLKTQHHLIPQVRTEARHGISNHNPYIAFRRRTEKMQTRKNRKNDESSYEKMLKLRRDLSRAVTLLEMVKRREKSKREHLHLSIEVFEKRYQAGDYAGQVVNEALSQRPTRPAFTQLYQGNHLPWSKDNPILSSLTRKEKRQYKKRRHKSSSAKPIPTGSGSSLVIGPTASTQSFDYTDGDLMMSSDDEVVTPPSEADEEEEGPFPFRRRLNCLYNLATDSVRSSPPRCSSTVEEGTGDKCNFFPASTKLQGHFRYIGAARRRLGRGGRLVIDRQSRDNDNFWRSLGFDIFDSERQEVSDSSVSANETYTLGNPPSPKQREVAPPRIIDILKPVLETLTPQPLPGPSPSSSVPCSASSPSRSQTIASILSSPKVQLEEEEAEQSPGPPTLAPFIGTVCCKTDEDIVFFEVAKLVTDPVPQESLDPPYFLYGDIEDPPFDTNLLDTASADLFNMQSINGPGTQRALPDLTIDPTPSFDLVDSESDHEYSRGSGKKTVIKQEADFDSPTDSPNDDPYGTVFTAVEVDRAEKKGHGQPYPPASTVSINVLLSPDTFVNHNKKSNGESMDVDSHVEATATDKYNHHSSTNGNGDGLDVDTNSDEGGQGSDQLLSTKSLPLSPSPQNGVAYLRDQFVSDCGDKTQRFKNLVYCPEIGIN